MTTDEPLHDMPRRVWQKANETPEQRECRMTLYREYRKDWHARLDPTDRRARDGILNGTRLRLEHATRKVIIAWT